MDGSGSSSGEGCLVSLRPAPLFSFDSLKRSFCVYCSSQFRRFSMADAPRIAVDELNRRMEAGESFTVIDVRNPQAWAESDAMQEQTCSGLLHLTRRGLQRQFGAETSATRVRECVGASRRIRCMAEGWIAPCSKTAGSLVGFHFNCHQRTARREKP